MRIDKFLCEMNIGSRSEVKQILKAGLVKVNDHLVKQADFKVDPLVDLITFKGQKIEYIPFYYYMLNKPAGVVSATTDNTAKTVVELLGADKREDLFPVGRLDKDTTGLLLLTNDGSLAHQLLSPKKHIDKTYLVTTSKKLSSEDIARLEQGVDIGECQITMPARVESMDDFHIYLTIQEGKFHQVKRMLQAVNNKVCALQRVSFGPLSLDESLLPGEYRSLTDEELTKLRSTVCTKC